MNDTSVSSKKIFQVIEINTTLLKNKGLMWVLMKMEMRGFIIAYARKKQEKRETKALKDIQLSINPFQN